MPVVRVEDELDPHAAGSLLEAMQDAMGRNGSQVIIDLKDCSYIGSAGLGVLFSLVSRARQNGGPVAAVRPPMQVLRILQLVRMTDERGFQVFADLESAQAALASA